MHYWVLGAIPTEGRIYPGTRRSTVDNTIAGGARFWLMGESLNDDGDILGVRETVRTSTSLIINKIVRVFSS